MPRYPNRAPPSFPPPPTCIHILPDTAVSRSTHSLSSQPSTTLSVWPWGILSPVNLGFPFSVEAPLDSRPPFLGMG